MSVNLGNITMEIAGDRMTFTYSAPSVPGMMGARPGLALIYDRNARRVVGVEGQLSRTHTNPMTMTRVTGRWRVPIDVFPRDMGQALNAQIMQFDPHRRNSFRYPLRDFCNLVMLGGAPMTFEQYMALFEHARQAAVTAPLSPITAARLAQFLPLGEAMYRSAVARCSHPGASF